MNATFDITANYEFGTNVVVEINDGEFLVVLSTLDEKVTVLDADHRMYPPNSVSDLLRFLEEAEGYDMRGVV